MGRIVRFPVGDGAAVNTARLRNLGFFREPPARADDGDEPDASAPAAPAVIIHARAHQVIVIDCVQGDLYLGHPADWATAETPGV